MVDFKKLRERKAKPRPLHPRDVFNALPRPSGINDLYASQAEVLDTWYARRKEKDIVVKLHTGGGKTLVALLMAQSVLNELDEPVLYLSANNQLVNQVLAMSKDYGVSAVPYEKNQPLPIDFLDGRSVLVGAYETLFNGRSKFGVRGSRQQATKVGALILDDAHVALSSVREAFSLTISASEHQEVYSELAGRFRTAFKDVGRNGAFADITRGEENSVLEVPSWAWQRKFPEIQDYLSRKANNIDRFVWPLLRDHLNVCHCLFSRHSVTITPIFPPVDLLPTFEDCARRIYMSATIADDSEIVRTFAVAPDAVARAITSSSLAGVGERMILVPELMKLGATPIRPMVKKIVKKLPEWEMGVVILVPSGKTTEVWTDVAEHPDTAKAVFERISAMQSGKFHGPLVLANRYDGIDLAGDACRFLVMDDLPQGTSDYDVYRTYVVADSAANSLLAQRIEQGIGRGTRGGGDFCVVVLTGNKLVGWISKKKNLPLLTASTRVQLKMGQEISAAVATVKEVGQTVLKCLRRDPDWVSYHASELSEAARAAPVNNFALRVAGGERRAFNLQRIGQYESALATLDKLIEDPEVASDRHRRAWLSALAARIAYQMGDEFRGQRLQTTAFKLNNNHTPPKTRPAYTARPLPSKQSSAIVNHLLEYERRHALLADFDEAVAELVPEASPGRYEEALRNLGFYLGFDAERPEKVYGRGPDVLWRTDAHFDFVIEAKSRKQEDNPLYKNDHAQLLEAEHWFKSIYPHRNSVRVSALPEAIADDKATPKGTYAFRLTDITSLAGALRGVLTELIATQGNGDVLRERCEAGLQQAKLLPDGIRMNFMRPFETAD